MSRNRVPLFALVALAVPAVVATLTILIDPGAPTGTAPAKDLLSSRIETFTDALSAGQPYRPPDAAERSAAARGFADLVSRDQPADADLAKLGFTTADFVDPETRRPYTVIQNEPGTDRAWGLYLVDRSAPPSLAIEVPHPAFDLHTELFGLDLFRRTPGAVLMVAGAQRRADGNRADVAHEANSVFHVVATGLAGRGLAQVQLHGFDNESAPGYDVVLSTGPTPTSAAAVRLAGGFQAAGFATCRAWAQVCAGLEGETNVQGQLAKAAGTVFLHVELSRTVRDSDRSRSVVGMTLASAGI